MRQPCIIGIRWRRPAAGIATANTAIIGTGITANTVAARHIVPAAIARPGILTDVDRGWRGMIFGVQVRTASNKAGGP